MEKDWREIALKNQATMADLHKRRTASESRSISKQLDARKKANTQANKPPRMSKGQRLRYWMKRAEIAESAVKRQGGKPASGPTFYESKAWQVLRYKALKQHGGKCQLCGNSGKLHVDHIKPRHRFPELELRLDNLQVLCKDCNLGKGAWDDTDWRKLSLKNVPGD